jgi:hypothetical protein
MNLVEVTATEHPRISNARLHAEIERLATTGRPASSATGSFMKLSEELKRADGAERLSFSCGHRPLQKVNAIMHPVGDLVLKGVSKVLRTDRESTSRRATAGSLP